MRCWWFMMSLGVATAGVLLAACGSPPPQACVPPEGFKGIVEQRAVTSAQGCCTLVAHAGGSVDGNPYTNSREATLLSIESGFRLIELDFSRTREGAWFTTHDWEYWAQRTGYKGELPPPTGELQARKSDFTSGGEGKTLGGTYTTMSLDEVVELLKAHPQVMIVTDTKDDRATLALIEQLQGSPTFKRFVFQVYSVQGLQRAAREVPEQQLSLTTYQLDWFSPNAYDMAFLAEVNAYPQLHSFTLPLQAAVDAAKMGRIKSTLSIPIWTHGPPSRINSRNLQTQLARRGVNGLFVD